MGIILTIIGIIVIGIVAFILLGILGWGINILGFIGGFPGDGVAGCVRSPILCVKFVKYRQTLGCFGHLPYICRQEYYK